MAVKPFNLVSDIKTYLLQEPVVQKKQVYETAGQLSIHDYAEMEKMSLRDFILQKPDYAMVIADRHFSYWKSVVQSAALTGKLKLDDNQEVRLGREQQKLLELALKQAEKDVAQVWAIASTIGAAGEARKESLIRALYTKATSGNLRAIEYLMDKVDSAESELDHSNKGAVYSILYTLFDKQLEVLNAGPGSKIVCCSRRSGKTHLAAALCLIEALRTTNTTCIVIGETMHQEEDLINTAMNTIVDACNLTDSKGRRLNWKHLENGSKILVRGLSNTQDPDTIRGYKAKVIIIDEFFHLKDDLLEYLQKEVLEPMQLDYATDYHQIMIGTPPRIKGTYGERVWNEAQIPHFNWYAKDNPYVHDFDAFVAEKAREKGIEIDSPWIQREYFGRWVYDADLLLYPEYHTYNANDVLPTLQVSHILCGLDYGVSDHDAIVAVAWDKDQRRGFVFYESKFNRLTISKDITQLEQMKREVMALWKFSLDFFPNLMKSEANKKVIWQADSNDQHLTQELFVNCQIDGLKLNIGNAHKPDKVVMQDKIRDLLRTADLLLPEAGLTVKECDMTILKRDPMGNITMDIDDKAYHPDILDSLRYALWPILGFEAEGTHFEQSESAGGVIHG